MEKRERLQVGCVVEVSYGTNVWATLPVFTGWKLEHGFKVGENITTPNGNIDKTGIWAGEYVVVSAGWSGGSGDYGDWGGWFVTFKKLNDGKYNNTVMEISFGDDSNIPIKRRMERIFI